MKCPVCGNKLETIETVKEIPYFGKVLISTLKCNKCGWKDTKIYILESKPPVEFKYTINKDNLGKLFVLSEGTTINIPELGITYKSVGENKITTLEGLIMDIIDRLKILKDEKVKELEKILEQVKEGNRSLDIEVRDELGLSKVLDW
ncbi:NEQ321 [Nanoarchaeum equitans Kin4-M]|uniref:NEQ321 n=1 Tax=Nanoarchaeum equitans (strain Kin4-M) TaxID=228908 RepID=Q74MA2_NANEQ|nr:NEQ321 [Nanoarchaeum equitans Kin4-M]